MLRIARPLHFYGYRKDSVRIDGATRLPDIHVKRRSRDEFLPPTQDLLDQLTGSEWLVNMPGTAHEKRLYANNCTMSCHGGERPFHVRYNKRKLGPDCRSHDELWPQNSDDLLRTDRTPAGCEGHRGLAGKGPGA